MNKITFFSLSVMYSFLKFFVALRHCSILTILATSRPVLLLPCTVRTSICFARQLRMRKLHLCMFCISQRWYEDTSLHTQAYGQINGRKKWIALKITPLHWRMPCIFYSLFFCFRTTRCGCSTRTTPKIRLQELNPNLPRSSIMDQHREDFAVCISWRE